jgi:hypothetical protein
MSLSTRKLGLALRDFLSRAVKYSILVAIAVGVTAFFQGGMTGLRWLAVACEIGAVVTAAIVAGARFFKSDYQSPSSNA